MKKSLVQNTTINLFGLALPLLLAIALIPKTIFLLGNEKFSLLTLIWAVVGYFSIFDLGIGRSLTNYVAENESRINTSIFIRTVNSTLTLLILFSVAISFAIFFTTQASNQWIQNTDFPPAEIFKIIFYVCVSIPFITISTSFKGILEGLHDFKIASYINILTGIGTFAIPFIMAYIDKNLNLSNIVLAMLLWRIFLTLVNYIWIQRNHQLIIKPIFEFDLVKPILKKGGWITITNIISPIMAYLDRFFLTKFVPMNQISFYTTPFEMVSKIWILPTAVTKTSFTRFSNLTNDLNSQKDIYYRSFVILNSLLTPLVSFVYLFSYLIIELWISKEYANNSSHLMQIFVVGIYINSLNWISFALLQTKETLVKWTAIIPIFELIIYLPAFLFATQHSGLVGAAYVWSIRLIIDAIIFFVFSIKTIHLDKKHILIITLNILTLILFLVGTENLSLIYKSFIFMFYLLLFYYLNYVFGLNSSEKNIIATYYQKIKARL